MSESDSNAVTTSVIIGAVTVVIVIIIAITTIMVHTIFCVIRSRQFGKTRYNELKMAFVLVIM